MNLMLKNPTLYMIKIAVKARAKFEPLQTQFNIDYVSGVASAKAIGANSGEVQETTQDASKSEFAQNLLSKVKELLQCDEVLSVVLNLDFEQAYTLSTITSIKNNLTTTQKIENLL